jgi:hypothetical protein
MDTEVIFLSFGDTKLKVAVFRPSGSAYLAELDQLLQKGGRRREKSTE